MSEKKLVRLSGGPLDGQTKEVELHETRIEFDQPAEAEDLRPGEIPVGFFPPFHKYIYQETEPGSDLFQYKH